MNNRCLYCYQRIETETRDFHPSCSKAFFGTSLPPVLEYSLDQMAELAAGIVRRSVAVPGVQPKLSLALVRDAIAKPGPGRLTIVGTLGGNYILKPPTADYAELPANEHLTMMIAGSFGINVVPSSLIRLSSGEFAYITKRIDRGPKGIKIHMLDMFQVLEAFDKYKGSMEKIAKAIAKYSGNTLLDLLNFFELTVFCFLTGNNDMHLKNFSLIVGENDVWTLAPAYDLLNVSIINPADKEESALSIDARKTKLNRKRFHEFGVTLGLSTRQIDGVFQRISKNYPIAESLCKDSFLTQPYADLYLQLISERFARLQ